ncbi:MAG: glycine--tRNA ligase subunit beta [bacterium]|nr:glycine--tRNA ligase subunit beta [bacterium]
MANKSFLLEIGSEEIPVSYVEPAMNQLAAEMDEWLTGERLAHGEILCFATPRRIALLVKDLVLKQDDFEEEVTGPPKAAAYRDGEPTKAATGFARGQGVAMEDLYFVETPKGEYLAAHKKTPGRLAAEILAEGLPARILALRFPKTMTWGDGSLRFARPIRWVVALLGEEIVDFKLGTLRASRTSYGHRLLSPGPVTIPVADEYERSLAGANVTADPRVRRAEVLRLARAEAEKMGGCLVEDGELVDTVNYLVEKAAVLSGSFDEDFLELPREVITTAMKSHQRYFSAENDAGSLLPGFIVILNGERSRPDVVSKGNERVLQARLEDARFYWKEDCRAGLVGMLEKLKSVLWLEGFGSIADRADRLQTLGGQIADLADGLTLDREALKWASNFCKADLASEMVKDGKEFTKLQGYMGQEYARVAGVPDVRGAIIQEHCYPRFAGDRLPQSDEAVVLALADRLDAIVGFWLAGFMPTGSKDPYALRRQALAVLRLMLERELPLDLVELLERALALYPGKEREGADVKLRDFFKGRLRVMLESEGVAPDIYDAVMATGESRILDLKARALALNSLRGDPAFEKLVIGARRVGNILAKADWQADSMQSLTTLDSWADAATPEFGFTHEMLVEQVEKDLCATLGAAAGPLRAEAGDRQYDAAYRRLADLGEAIDSYFDGVMVNAEDQALRENRLAFLKNLAQTFAHFADFSKVVLEGERED